MHVFDLVELGARAARRPNPCESTRCMLTALRERLDEVHEALDFCACDSPEEAPDRQIFYRSPNLAMMRICFCPGLRTPPHNHATWAAILMLSGKERNTLYRRCSTHGLVRKEDIVLEAGSVFLMEANDIHVAECAADHPAVALHVYGGDLDLLPRSVWHPETLEEFPMELNRYEKFSRLASADASAPISVTPAALPA